MEKTIGTFAEVQACLVLVNKSDFNDAKNLMETAQMNLIGVNCRRREALLGTCRAIRGLSYVYMFHKHVVINCSVFYRNYALLSKVQHLPYSSWPEVGRGRVKSLDLKRFQSSILWCDGDRGDDGDG